MDCNGCRHFDVCKKRINGESKTFKHNIDCPDCDFVFRPKDMFECAKIDGDCMDIIKHNLSAMTGHNMIGVTVKGLWFRGYTFDITLCGKTHVTNDKMEDVVYLTRKDN